LRSTCRVTGAAPGPGLTSITDAGCVLAALDAAGAKRAALVGHSMGSLIALATGSARADRIAALGACSASRR